MVRSAHQTRSLIDFSTSCNIIYDISCAFHSDGCSRPVHPLDGRLVPFPRVIYDDVSRGATGHEKTPPRHLEVGLRGWIDFLDVPFPGSLYRPYRYVSFRIVWPSRKSAESCSHAGRETGRAIRRDDGTKTDEEGKKDTTERE